MITRGEQKGEREKNRHTLHEDSILKQAVKTIYISYQDKPTDSFTKQLIKQPTSHLFIRIISWNTEG